MVCEELKSSVKAVHHITTSCLSTIALDLYVLFRLFLSLFDSHLQLMPKSPAWVKTYGDNAAIWKWL